MKRLLNNFLSSRFWALFQKEVSQIQHNKQLLIQLLVPPTVFLILFGFALNPTFQNLQVGITDYSQSRASREFVNLFHQTDAFVIHKFYADAKDMADDLAVGKLTVGITIPPEFDRDFDRNRPTQVQALFDAVDANTASVASGYLTQLVSDYNAQKLAARPIAIPPAIPSPTASPSDDSTQLSTPTPLDLSSSQFGDGSIASAPIQASPPSSNFDQSSGNQTTSSDSQNDSSQALASLVLQQNQVQVKTSIFYNPGLKASWFIVPGTIGILLTVIGSQAAASLVVREKEAGTIEQLIMTPASNTEVILAKIAPLLVLLTLDSLIALSIGKVAFDLPFRGSLLLFLLISILYFFVGISIGIMIASYAKTQQQAQLTAFFINPPLVLLSGANTPIAAMPTFMQWITYLNPMRYYIEVCRGILLKGVGLSVLWSQVVILLVFAILLLTLSVRQFRRQLN